MNGLVVTESRVQLAEPTDAGKNVMAYLTIVLNDCLVIKEVKVIRTRSGYHVALPSRPARVRCPDCRVKNSLDHRFCSACGRLLPPKELVHHHDRYLDVVHPISAAARCFIHDYVLGRYREALEDAGRAGDYDYRPDTRV